MVHLLLVVVFFVLALLGLIVRKAFFRVPLRELERRAGRGDAVARQFYLVAAFNGSARLLLWGYIGLASAASLVFLAKITWPLWVSVIVGALELWVLFSLTPATRLGGRGEQWGLTAVPFLVALLKRLDPLLYRLARRIDRRYEPAMHTRLYEKEDLLELLERQRLQLDSRFTPEELEVASRALNFGDHKVSDMLIPADQVETVLQNDTVGPILIDEVHRSGQAYALVRSSKKGQLVGILETRRLGLHSSGKVSDHMRSAVYYLHEADTLAEALHAFSVTNFPVFVVIDSDEAFKGIVTVASTVERLLGHLPGDDFEEYANPVTIADRHAAVKTDSEVVE